MCQVLHQEMASELGGLRAQPLTLPKGREVASREDVLSQVLKDESVLVLHREEFAGGQYNPCKATPDSWRLQGRKDRLGPAQGPPDVHPPLYCKPGAAA